MTQTGYIDDGYNRKAVLEERKFHYSKLALEFRPLTARQRAVENNNIARIRGDRSQEEMEEAEDRINEVLNQQIQSWTLKYKKKTVEKTAKNMGKLDPLLQGALFNLVWGNYEDIKGLSFPDEDGTQEDEEIKNS